MPTDTPDYAKLVGELMEAAEEVAALAGKTLISLNDYGECDRAYSSGARVWYYSFIPHATALTSTASSAGTISARKGRSSPASRGSTRIWRTPTTAPSSP